MLYIQPVKQLRNNGYLQAQHAGEEAVMSGQHMYIESMTSTTRGVQVPIPAIDAMCIEHKLRPVAQALLLHTLFLQLQRQDPFTCKFVPLNTDVRVKVPKPKRTPQSVSSCRYVNAGTRTWHASTSHAYMRSV